MSSQQLRCDSDSDDINFDGKSVEEAGPSTSTSASTLVCVARHPNAKRYLVGCRLTSTPLQRKSKRTTWIFR